MQFEPGDYLVSSRPGYTHHGIFAGDGMVIHYAGLATGLNRSPVEITTLEAFSAGREVRVRSCPNPEHGGENAVTRARSRLGEDLYDIRMNNCEHFCSWVRTGKHVSTQVRTVEALIGVVGADIEELRRQRSHRSTAAGTALETGKAIAKALVGTTGAGALPGTSDVLKQDVDADDAEPHLPCFDQNRPPGAAQCQGATGARYRNRNFFRRSGAAWRHFVKGS